MNKVNFFLITALIFTACKSEQHQDQKSDYEMEGPIIVIPQNSNLRGKIKTLKITKEPYSKTIQSPANVEGNPTKMAKITPPLAGRILKIYIHIGETVKAGDVLFSMDAPEFVDAQRNFLSVKQELLKAETRYNREKDLTANGVGIKKDLEESQRDLSIRKSEFDNAAARLKLYGIDYETMTIGDPLKIKAPVSGRVSEIEMTQGQFRNDLTDVLMTVADLSEVWITANVKEKDIRYIHQGDPVIAQVVAYPGKEYKGKVLFVDDILNPETHSLKVRIQMPNPERELKPGMFASIIFIEKPVASILIPKNSLLQKDDKSFVFVEVSSGKYKKKFVEPSETTNGKVLIINGLEEEEVIVAEGGFYLLEAR